MENWYVLHSKPNAEYQVANALKGRGIQTYLPEIEAPKARLGRKRQPFFPCYLFVRVDLEAVGLSQVQWIPGLRRIVACGDQPTSVANEVIELIQRSLGEMEASGGLAGHTFKPGDTVRITDGPMQGMLAVFERPTTPSERVQVLLTFLGHANRVWVPVTDLEKVTPESNGPASECSERRRRTRGRGRRIQRSFQP
jgi:transcriptional antiterminator RfaH